MNLSKKMLSILLCLTLVMSLFVGIGAISASAGTEMAGTVDLLGPGNGIKWYSDTVTKLSDMQGSGTAQDPYIITTAAELRCAVHEGGANHYKLGNDIVINDTTAADWYNGTGLRNWMKGKRSDGTTSEGYEAREMSAASIYTGTFDGNGHTISGLYINYEASGKNSVKTTVSGFALFPMVNGATIKNVQLKDVYIKSNTTDTTACHAYGALTGYVFYGGVNVENVAIENVKFELNRTAYLTTQLANAYKLTVGGVVSNVNGPVNITDVIVKNFSSNVTNAYATWRAPRWEGSLVPYIPWGQKCTLTNVIAYGNYPAFSNGSVAANGAASSSYHEPSYLTANNVYIVAGATVPTGIAAKVTEYADEAALLNNLETFYDNIGTSTNWTTKSAKMLPQLKDFRTASKNSVIYEDYENRVVVNKFIPSPANGGYYGNESRLTGSLYWSRSSWAVITSDANPKYTDASYNSGAYNEYMKMTYVYQGIDISGTERQVTSHDNYKKATRPNQYKDYAFSPIITIPNKNIMPDGAFIGEAGKEYTVYIDIALVEDDDQKVEFYASLSNFNASTNLYGTTAMVPREAVGDILIASTEATGDKKLETQSKGSYEFKTYSFTFKAVDGKTPLIYMVTNDGNTINAAEGKTDFACAYVDNIEVVLTDNYLDVVSPTSSILNVKYTSDQKLADIPVELEGYADDGKWYDDYDCTIVSTEEYPIAGKVYYRKWHKYIKLDFEREYIHALSGYSPYLDPHDPTNPNAKYHTRSDVTRQTVRNNNGVIELTYSNDNPVYTDAGFNYGPSGEWFHNYGINPFVKLFEPSTGVWFTGSAGFKYTISFDYEIVGPIPQEDVSFYLYFTDEKTSVSDTAVGSLKGSNNILVGKFDVNVADGSKGTASLEFVAKMGYFPRIIMVTNDGVRLEENPTEYHTAYLDNITIVEKIPEGRTPVSVIFDTDGGSETAGIRVLKDDPIGKLPTPTKSGYLFDCWYLDGDANKVEIDSSYVVTESIKLKAKWTPVTKANYDSEGFENFDNVRYPNVIKDYNDLNLATLKNNGKLDSTMTVANRFIEENCPDGMGAALLISNSPSVMSNSKALPATVLLNKDGSKYTVKSGVVYKLEYDYLPLGETTAHSYIGVKYGSYSLDSLDGSQAVGSEKVAVHGLKAEKETVTQYFKPSTDGFIYFTLGSRQNFDDTSSQHFVLIDNVKLTVVDNAKSITFKDADTDKVVDSRPVGFGYHIQYGMPGDTIREFAINTQKGKQIQGFYNDKACTIPCTDYNVIGETNKTVYVKMKDVDYSELSDFDSPIVLDFETSQEFDLEIFYRYMPYMSWTCSELDNNLDYIGNDAKNAFDGSGYLRIKDYEFSYGIQQSFALYDKNNPSGLMILAPNTTYRITAQVKYEDDAKIPSLKIYSINLSNLAYTRYASTLTTKNDDMMGYGEISGLITTGDEAVGIAIGAVFLAEQNVYIDNVKVEKVVEKTITFETNGGDKIDPVVVLPYSELTSYDPGFAFKPGYEFIGWFLDKDFTKPFDFLSDVITDNITLYAKYVKEEVEDEEIGDNEGIIEDEEPKGFGDNLTVTDADPIERADTDVDDSSHIWIIVIAIIGGLLVLAGATVVVIVLVKRKKR